MTFRDYIISNLAVYPGIVEDESVIQKINVMLESLQDARLGSLVSNFCTNPDARDILFEVWVGYQLLNNPKAENLQYEPVEEKHPPDFRFNIGNVNFDVQVKRLHNVKNEMTKMLFKRECNRHLSSIQKPWFINFWISETFTPQHLNEFFSYFKKNITSFEPGSDPLTALSAKQYCWIREGEVLVSFSFSEKNSRKPGISIGVTYETGKEPGVAGWVDVEAYRKALLRQLRRSRTTLRKDVSDKQANIVIIQVADNVSLENDTMSDVLYGNEVTQFTMMENENLMYRLIHAPGGLFNGERFSTICGVILVPQAATPISDNFIGCYFPNPKHFMHIADHPSPFDATRLWVLNEWRGEVLWRSAN